MKKKILYLLSIIAVILQVCMDQYTKILSVRYLKGEKGIVLIDGVLQLFYVENRGAAFGILQNSTVFFCIVTAFILVAIIYVYIRMPFEKKYMPLFVLLSFLTAGAIGNLIDRVANGFVVDFIYFSLIDFPVFNMADIYVTVSTALIILLSLFKYRDDDFAFLRFKRDADFHENELLKKDFKDSEAESEAPTKTESES